MRATPYRGSPNPSIYSDRDAADWDLISRFPLGHHSPAMVARGLAEPHGALATSITKGAVLGELCDQGRKGGSEAIRLRDLADALSVGDGGLSCRATDAVSQLPSRGLTTKPPSNFG
ncbi:hypothetical protein Q31a_22790 [Aureliella helgolandensis]|uniref:Uncharacterized protein n=1 Tax=Aureliella helgolandensis TaxID=2527968 RepID=A0A518G5U0_9BACT|nr:hypothetical protein Q31a_22790 [Aureliella helgolandensis]